MLIKFGETPQRDLTPARIVLLLVHLIYGLVEWALENADRLRKGITNLLGKDREQEIAKQPEERQLELQSSLIEYGIRQLTKVPSHLVVILGSEEPADAQQLVKFIFWGMAAGVGHVSFYDHRGILKRNHHEMLSYVSRRPRTDSDQIVWTPQLKTAGGLLPPRNGYRRRIVVSFFCPEDGKGQLATTASNISKSLVTGELRTADQITIELVDRKLQERFHHIPDPDLALYYGTLCTTYGLLPWHIRLTEFIPMEAPSLAETRPTHFLNSLHRYARVQQRFGK
ncbi:dehydrodolichyl diphosphate synthase complex subunit nus1 [Uranotaenia lowii]|uniref:dehydrodolichyl diphosphate synthase complex subunit nus1 n=1 Tax=Uranotaenia lowii TaxID=190385 RepID=UPI0024783732|nr:dehydrodolichyl diphosphate synthase complex subunit nus1 [Uranotaenia lowii]